MVRKVVVRAVVAGAAVLVSVLGAVAVGAGGPVRHGSPAEPPAGACGGSADVQCLASRVAWNGTGLVIVNPRGV
ncbi:hypothetical protein ACIRD3_09955 [Kitasatospora sp. NPDC093550]|uniref:hypothetical protein n=1 Tax=Kitasatospora sp. NPDC093550 TaxID=3364089 RepID=UPI0037F8FE57